MTMILDKGMAADPMSEQGKVWRIGDIVETALVRHGAQQFVPGSHGWYIVYLGGGEGRAIEAMGRRGWTAYRPMATRWVVVKQRGGLRADRTQSKLRKGKSKRPSVPPQQRITAPLYPRYVFVAVDPRRGTWWDLQEIPGVAAVIRHGSSEVVRLSDAVIDVMRRHESEGVFDEKEPPKSLKLKAGTLVRVVKGPFDGFSGIVESGGDSATVKCAVLVFGGSTPVYMPLDHVEVT